MDQDDPKVSIFLEEYYYENDQKNSKKREEKVKVTLKDIKRNRKSVQ